MIYVNANDKSQSPCLPFYKKKKNLLLNAKTLKQ